MEITFNETLNIAISNQEIEVAAEMFKKLADAEVNIGFKRSAFSQDELDFIASINSVLNPKPKEEEK